MIGWVYALRLDTLPVCYVVGSTANPVAERIVAYFDPARSHGHIANLVRRAGPLHVSVVHLRAVRYRLGDAAELERRERDTAKRWRSRGLLVFCDK